ncbi:GGDEF domain-containing protein [Hwanghaeella sp.]|uniref:GGDEF domain-containing protein n=1 Tax=Hwanghaeella sp. TaxID=2605943 RepID=UPI003CCBBAE5
MTNPYPMIDPLGLPAANDTVPDGLGGEAGSRLANRLEEVAGDLIASAGDAGSPGDGYRRLLHKAMLVAAEAQRELHRKDRELRALRLLSITDEITKLLNRRGFDRAFDRSLARSRRSNERGLLLIVDLDHFKRINDTHGHVAGDLVLASVATLLRVNTREIDDVARIGGDEFAVLLNGADDLQGYQKVTQLEVMLNNLTVPWDGERIQVHASIGAAPFGPHDDPVAVMRTADECMYGRKRGGIRPDFNQSTIEVKALPAE